MVPNLFLKALWESNIRYPSFLMFILSFIAAELQLRNNFMPQPSQEHEELY